METSSEKHEKDSRGHDAFPSSALVELFFSCIAGLVRDLVGQQLE